MIKNLMILTCIGVFFVFLSCDVGKKAQGTNVTPTTNTDTIRRLASYNGDTAAYLANMVKNKEKYIGKPLSVFLQELETPIVSFSAPSTLRKTENSSLRLLTNDGVTHYQKLNNGQAAFEIGIDWKIMQSMEDVKIVKNKNVQEGRSPTEWTRWAKEYFGKNIVGNIYIVR